MSVYSPIDSDGAPIEPGALPAHSAKTTFPVAHCWCGRKSRFFQVKAGPLIGSHVFACYSRPGPQSCSFYGTFFSLTHTYTDLTHYLQWLLKRSLVTLIYSMPSTPVSKDSHEAFSIFTFSVALKVPKSAVQPVTPTRNRDLPVSTPTSSGFASSQLSSCRFLHPAIIQLTELTQIYSQHHPMLRFSQNESFVSQFYLSGFVTHHLTQ